MDLLIVLSTTTACIYSLVAYAYLAVGQPLLTGEFFETGTLLVTLIMAGRTVSSFARQRALESITVESLQTNTAIIIDHESSEENSKEKEIDGTTASVPRRLQGTPRYIDCYGWYCYDWRE